MRRGEVWWHAPRDAKRRPALVLTRDETIGRVFDVIAMPTTGVIRGLPTEIGLDASDGMPRDCVLVPENTFSADKSLLTERITTLGPEKLDQACRALVHITSCG